MKKNIKYFIVIILVGILAWYKVLSFWFFRAYEATWLTGLRPYNIVNLIKGHGFLYFLDYKLFGWNPIGWYATGLLLHLVASIIFFYLVFKLSKNRLLAFLSSLFFVASTAYHDVLTWASFNSYYPLLLSLLLLTLITYHFFKEKKNILFLLLSLLCSFLGFYVRETGIIIVPFIFAYEVIFTKITFTKKSIFGLFKHLSPFVILLILFFVLRTLYGGTGGDTADGNVQLQIRLMKDGLYWEYVKTVFLTLGKLIPPQIIPYTFLNTFREYLYKYFDPNLINTYFFPALGWLIFAGYGMVLFLLRKSKQYFRTFLFFGIWLSLFLLFISLAIPNTPDVLARGYEYNTMRYRYFSFLGVSVILAGFLIEIVLKKSKKLVVFIVAAGVLSNLLMLWKIEKDIYRNVYSPAKNFNLTFKKYFPNLPKDAVFYIYPNASGLSDYLLEWFLMKEDSYPNLIDEPFRVESQMIAVINKIKNGEIKLDDVFFLDHNQKQGLLNRTDEVKKIILEKKDYLLSFVKIKDNNFTAGTDGPAVEFPYDLEISLTLSPKSVFVGSRPNSVKFRTLVDYAVEKTVYLNNVAVTTAYTASQREGEPFFFALSSHLTDGNVGQRSRWFADTFTPWVVVDLGSEKEIAAVIWGSESGPRSPATYSIFSSKDGKNWQIIKSVKNFEKTESIDVFEKPVRARYIKMEIYTTSGGSLVVLDEFEVVSENSKKILELYKDRKELLFDLRNLYDFAASKEDLNYAVNRGLNISWGKMSWQINKAEPLADNQYWYFPYKVNVGEQKVTILLPESEFYDGSGQFLNNHITSLSLDFGEIPYIISTGFARLVPRKNLE